MFIDNLKIRMADIQAIKHWIDNAAGTIPPPMFVDLHLSYTCNYACKGCAYGGQSKLGGWCMDEIKSLGLINTLLKWGVMAFDFAGGGEPLLMPGIIDRWREINTAGGYYGLITNGYYLTDDIIEELVDSGTYCRVSLEMPNKALFNQYKGLPEDAQDFDIILNNIIRLVKKRNEANSPLEVSIKFAVGKTFCFDNGQISPKAIWDRIHEGYILYKQLGVNSVTYKALRHEPEELSQEQKKLTLDELQGVFRTEMDICANHGLDFGDIHVWIDECDAQDIPQCKLSPLHTVLDWQGNIYICCYYYYREKEHLLGNIFKDDIRQLWGSKKHLDKVRQIDREKCKLVDCKFFKHHADTQVTNNDNGRKYFL